ncbi:TetR/AcrR family transcriptional regulator [Culicoidibacter larvae]|uniref:TetR/AcrR family transcriptional regulator n=1 Tax=Culicoidibacter larvae TaxID=2579976 RepID=A0A5R8QFF7_9FIRM|nr:TetR/AcrR family transcriptional regulator [Culicoidibacter larvae]TLG76712.1 TetR/AcrR family transcriptional regulator [Culicoidibacter larvae]
MNNIDLRVLKTRRAIKAAFLTAISNKTVDKITVTSLTKEAEINKGTFYLHYADIYALYDEMVLETVYQIVNKHNPYPLFFTNPEAFAKSFLFDRINPPSKEEFAILNSGNVRFATNYPLVFIDAFKHKIYESGTLTRCGENDIKLEYLINGMLALLSNPNLLQKNTPADNLFIIEFVAGSIRQLFPELYS